MYCCNDVDECKKRIDAVGNPVIPDEDVMLIFGGITYRNLTYWGQDGRKYSLFDECE